MGEEDPTLPRFGTDLITLRGEMTTSTRRSRVSVLTSLRTTYKSLKNGGIIAADVVRLEKLTSKDSRPSDGTIL